MRRRLALPIAAITLLGALAGTAMLVDTLELDRPTRRSLQGAGTVGVPAGASFGRVVDGLARDGWIRSARYAALQGRLSRVDRRLRPGRYRIEKGWTPRRILEELRGGNVMMARFTIPEGWRAEQILPALADSLAVSRDSVLAAASDSAWVHAVTGRRSLEGYLFPETYFFPKEAEPRAALRRMVRETEERITPAMRERAAKRGLDLHALLTFASVVQAEAAHVPEMPRIAAVFWNRLSMGWKLEADPTVRYALGRFTGPLLYRDLDVVSPYNTYRNGGLPPGPIGSPGDAALRAVLWPDSTRDELFFVARGGGEHAFSRTLAEHNRLKRVARAGGRTDR